MYCLVSVTIYESTYAGKKCMLCTLMLSDTAVMYKMTIIYLHYYTVLTLYSTVDVV